jgi:hypothetical protein
MSPKKASGKPPPAKKQKTAENAAESEELKVDDPAYKVKSTAILLTYHIREFTEENLVEMQTHFMELYPNAKISLALELTKDGETHEHVYIQNEKQMECALTHFDYAGSTPVDCQANRVKGS